jgi:hypothetical protein
MPYHSSKNFHRAQQEELDKVEDKYWENPHKNFEHHIHIYDRYSYSDCDWYCPCKEYKWSRAFNTSWVEFIGLRKSTEDCFCCNKTDCPYRGCACDLCYMYKKLQYTRNVVKEFFPTQQILDMDAPSDPRVFNKKELYQIALSSEHLEPVDINFTFIKRTTIDKCWKILQEELKEYHQQKEKRELVEMLAKYGLTLEEHQKLKQKRRLHKELLRKVIGGKPQPKKIDG